MLAYIRVRTDILTPSASKYTCYSEVRNAGAMKGASKAKSEKNKEIGNKVNGLNICALCLCLAACNI